MEYSEWLKLRVKFMEHLAKTPDTLWQPYERKIDEVVIANGPTGSVMTVSFVKHPNETLSAVSYHQFLEFNGIDEKDFLN